MTTLEVVVVYSEITLRAVIVVVTGVLEMVVSGMTLTTVGVVAITTLVVVSGMTVFLSILFYVFHNVFRFI